MPSTRAATRQRICIDGKTGNLTFPQQHHRMGMLRASWSLIADWQNVLGLPTIPAAVLHLLSHSSGRQNLKASSFQQHMERGRTGIPAIPTKPTFALCCELLG